MANPSAQEIYAAMGQALEGQDGEKLKQKFKACVVFVVEDDTWCLDAVNGTLTREASPDAALTVTVSLTVLQELLAKKLTPQQAFMKGKLKIKGNMSLAMKLTTVLAATRKYLPSAKL